MLSAALFLVIVDVFIQGPLVELDLWVHRFDGQKQYPNWDRVAMVYDNVGQRGVLIPLLLIVAGVLAWRHRTWRPVSLAVFDMLTPAFPRSTGRFRLPKSRPAKRGTA